MEQNYTLQSLDGLPAGQHFLYNDIEFIKLGDEQGGMLCITAKIWKILPFDKEGSNRMRNSSLCKILHKKFLTQLCIEDVLMYEMNLTADNGDQSYGTLFVNIGLLSADLYRKYRKYIPSYNDWIWLCTPWYCSGDARGVRGVGPDRTLYRGDADNVHGVVPAVVFNKYTIVKLKN
uniref:Uncharacterized protein n=1 Tax=Podoviridae sp. ctaNW81 TaxID=2826562 RepID=A0A8S5M5H5_9CAUD|nr:MAG TPA: hypothetical protein [Podoviridae sp. ctaNW81]